MVGEGRLAVAMLALFLALMALTRSASPAMLDGGAAKVWLLEEGALGLRALRELRLKMAEVEAAAAFGFPREDHSPLPPVPLPK